MRALVYPTAQNHKYNSIYQYRKTRIENVPQQNWTQDISELKQTTTTLNDNEAAEQQREITVNSALSQRT